MPSPDEITEFIRATFRSVWALELLCLLRRHEGSSVAHDIMVAELRGSDSVVTQGLGTLAAAGLVVVEADGAARYAPASSDLDRLASEADAAYRRGPDAVRRLIVNAAAPGIAAFADAFRLRKDRKDG
jgi:hypothetical protein